MSQQLSFLEQLEKPTLEALAKPAQIFESEDVEFVAALAEDTRFERKSARVQPNELAICLSAFGNGPAVEGGVVAIGIENDKTITGCNSIGESKWQELEFMGRDSCPAGRFSTKRLAARNKNGEEDFIILAKVEYVENQLVELTNGTAYCREADRSRRLTESEKQEVRINKGERAFELEQCSLVYPDDFRTLDLTKFARQIRTDRGGSPSISDEEIFESLRLGRRKDGKFLPNNVCALMFAKDPQISFAGSYVHFLRYSGNEEKSGSEYNVTKDRIISGTILDIIKNAASTLDANLREFTVFQNGKFHSVAEYPHDAWYELLVNAIVHRSYNARTRPVFVKMFDDHLVVESPGGFMPSVTPDNLFHKPRNPFLMFILREYGEVRCISEGTKRIKRELNDAQLPAVRYIGTNESVVATLQNDIAHRTNSLDSEAYKILGEALAFSLDADERKIVNYVVQNERINVSDALRILSTTYWHTAKAKLTRLVNRGILEFVSTKQRDPNSFYQLRNSASNKP